VKERRRRKLLLHCMKNRFVTHEGKLLDRGEEEGTMRTRRRKNGEEGTYNKKGCEESFCIAFSGSTFWAEKEEERTPSKKKKKGKHVLAFFTQNFCFLWLILKIWTWLCWVNLDIKILYKYYHVQFCILWLVFYSHLHKCVILFLNVWGLM